MAGKAFGGPFSQKVTQSRSHKPPLPPKVTKRYQKMLARVPHGMLYWNFGEKWHPKDPQSGLKCNILIIILRFSLVAQSHPNGVTWCPKGSKMRALGPQSAPKWSQVGSQGSPGMPKVPPNVQKDHLGKPPGTQVGPKVAQVPSRGPFLSGF